MYRIKVENDMGVATEEGCLDVEAKEIRLYMPSEFCVKKAVPEVSLLCDDSFFFTSHL